MPAYGKAYAAHAYRRLDDTAKSDDYLDRALEGATEDPITGVFWAPEKSSWIWYNHTVEKHAFLLRTLVKYRPNDKRIPGLVKWLLLNRTANDWKSTKATAGAVFSLIDVVKRQADLTKSETFQVEWTPLKEKRVVEPAELKSPLRFRRTLSSSA